MDFRQSADEVASADTSLRKCAKLRRQTTHRDGIHRRARRPENPLLSCCLPNILKARTLPGSLKTWPDHSTEVWVKQFMFSNWRSSNYDRILCHQAVSLRGSRLRNELNRVVLSWRVTYYKQVDPYEVNRNRLPLLRPEYLCGDGHGRIFVSRTAIHISRRRRRGVISWFGGAFSSVEL